MKSVSCPAGQHTELVLY